jgi:superfamily II DNA or RNA helicase
MNTVGYIYIRIHHTYDSDNACKLGKTINIPDRESQYVTGELRRGKMEDVYEVPIKNLGHIERLLQFEFKKFNITEYDGGTEFYNKKIIDLIEPYLISIGIKYKKLTKSEIHILTRCNRNRVKNTINKINIKALIRILKSKYTPRWYQKNIIDNAIIHFNTNDKGMLVLICGVGKTLISLWIAQELESNTILIGVPLTRLLKQWGDIINVLFKNVPLLIVKDGIYIDDITQFVTQNTNKCIVLTTYSSAHKVYTATQQSSFEFSIKINDEVHHLTTSNISSQNTKKYVEMLKIPATKQLSLTATLKHIDGICGDNVVSNDNVNYFGQIIDRKCLLWAINNNIICDYIIQTIITNEEQMDHILLKFNIIEENDKRLFLSAYISLKSIHDAHSHHLLVYCNKTANSNKVIKYIKMLLDDKYKYFDIPDIYYSTYHGDMNPEDKNQILKKFHEAPSGIITNMYCLGEGWDCPLLDGVVFAENMTSNIRIVQSALRASRKHIKDINKKNKIILPIFNVSGDDWNTNGNVDLAKVREVIYQMGLEDETITQKIKVYRVDIDKPIKIKKEKKEGGDIDNFGEYDDEFTQKLRLKTVNRTSLCITYEKAKKIIAYKNNIKSKTDYYKLCDVDNRLSKEPEITFYGRFTGWVDYLGIERIYYNLEECKIKINEYLLLHHTLYQYWLDLSHVCNELCKIDTSFPPNELWVEYYNVKDLTEIITITKKKKKKIGIIL